MDLAHMFIASRCARNIHRSYMFVEQQLTKCAMYLILAVCTNTHIT